MHKLIVISAILGLTACSSDPYDGMSYKDADRVKGMNALVETTPVDSSDDAADDPAIWIHPTDKARSLVLGTDKQAGMGVYALDGSLVQFLPQGRPNNVDIRQGVSTAQGIVDLAAYSDRAVNGIGVVTVTEDGVKHWFDSPVLRDEPYGFCLGRFNDAVYGFIAYKDGMLEQYTLDVATPQFALTREYQLGSQLEGCVFDDATGDLYVGEEAHGLWKFSQAHQALVEPLLIDKVGSETGIVADVEGVSLYKGAEASYIVISSQGNDSYALYDYAAPHAFVKRVRILPGTSVDGAQETDGIETTGVALPGFPNGLMVVQDGFNDDGKQNFKFINAEF